METDYGFTDDQLRSQPTVYRADLFAGRLVVVSGGASGLGKAIATLFARLGAGVVICGRNRERLNAAAGFLREFGGPVMAHAMTIREPGEVSALFDAVTRQIGVPDIVVNNAGGQFPQAALDFSPKGWRAVIDTNLNGTWYMMQTAARLWQAKGRGGSIVNVVADFWRGMPGIAHTAAARAGVAFLSKSVAVEWAPLDIRVNCVAPGCCETHAFALYPPEGTATYWEANPMLRPGDAMDIAEACAYLCGSSAKFVTGEVLTVDGGQQLWGDPWPTGRPDWFASRGRRD